MVLLSLHRPQIIYFLRQTPLISICRIAHLAYFLIEVLKHFEEELFGSLFTAHFQSLRRCGKRKSYGDYDTAG